MHGVAVRGLENPRQAEQVLALASVSKNVNKIRALLLAGIRGAVSHLFVPPNRCS